MSSWFNVGRYIFLGFFFGYSNICWLVNWLSFIEILLLSWRYIFIWFYLWGTVLLDKVNLLNYRCNWIRISNHRCLRFYGVLLRCHNCWFIGIFLLGDLSWRFGRVLFFLGWWLRSFLGRRRIRLLKWCHRCLLFFLNKNDFLLQRVNVFGVCSFCKRARLLNSKRN